jgi:hypothetical protein
MFRYLTRLSQRVVDAGGRHCESNSVGIDWGSASDSDCHSKSPLPSIAPGLEQSNALLINDAL